MPGQRALGGLRGAVFVHRELSGMLASLFWIFGGGGRVREEGGDE